MVVREGLQVGTPQVPALVSTLINVLLHLNAPLTAFFLDGVVAIFRDICLIAVELEGFDVVVDCEQRGLTSDNMLSMFCMSSRTPSRPPEVLLPKCHHRPQPSRPGRTASIIGLGNTKINNFGVSWRGLANVRFGAITDQHWGMVLIW